MGTKGRACDGKTKYTTHEAAIAAIDRMVTQGAAEAAQQAYRCKHCGSWHTGHISPRRRKTR